MGNLNLSVLDKANDWNRNWVGNNAGYSLVFQTPDGPYTFVPENVINQGLEENGNTYWFPYFQNQENINNFSKAASSVDLTKSGALNSLITSQGFNSAADYLQSRGMSSTGFLIPGESALIDGQVNTAPTSATGNIKGLSKDESGNLVYATTGGHGNRYLTATGDLHDPYEDKSWLQKRAGELGQTVLTVGSIFGGPLAPVFQAANAAAAFATGHPLQALAAALPLGLQEFATASNLADLAGNADFVSTAKTAAGKIAEAAGAPSAYADAFGKAGVAALRSGLTGDDLGKSLLMSQLPSAGSFVKNAGDFSKGIAGFDIGDTSEFDADALKGMDGWNSWEGGDNLNALDTVTVRPTLSDYGNPDYVTPPGQGMVDDTWTNEGIPEPSGSIQPSKVPPIFLPKTPTTPTSSKPNLNGLLSLLALKNSLDQPKIDAKFENFQSPTDLKGGYSFDWNAQPFKQPEDGSAYSQDYYGQQWNKTMAEGGVTSLVPFKPTIGDGGINANELSGSDIANQAIQHLRSGGHVMDDKTHSDIKYLASKGEPVHHIVGFMKHRMAGGGLTSLGSYSDGGHLLKGPGDGMSDDIPATIADKQPARLANEEFVIPADVVSHLGNGSSESGAKVLYEMMAKVRKARTGNPKQGKQIDAHKFMPKV